MTLVEIGLLIFTLGGSLLAVFLNVDLRKIYICIVIFAIQIAAYGLFEIIKTAEYLYWTIGILELIGILAVFSVFKIPEWQNEGYLLMVCFLLLSSAWNTVFYTYSQHFTLYADVADYLAVVTVAWMIGRSDHVVEYLSDYFDIDSSLRLN